jgi:hypothetical protein
MRVREETMLRELPRRRILVLPVGILNRQVDYSREAGDELARLLREVGFPLAQAGARTFVLPYPRQPNEAWTYWKRFLALAASVRASPEKDTDYLLLMDVFGGIDGQGELTGVGAVHVVGTTSSGDLAYGRLRNSHHDIFRRIKPRKMGHACQMAVEDLLASREALAPPQASEDGLDSRRTWNKRRHEVPASPSENDTSDHVLHLHVLQPRSG